MSSPLKSIALTKTNVAEYGVKVTHKGDGGWPQALSNLVGDHPATMAKIIKESAQAWLLFVNPNNQSARNAHSWSGNAKNFISIFETLAFGEKFYTEALRVAKDPSQVSTKDKLGTGVFGLLTVSEGLNGYATLAKAGIFFTATATKIAVAKLFHELTGGIAAVLGTMKSVIVIDEATQQLQKLEKESKSNNTNLLETKIKAQRLTVRSEQIFAIKNINYVAFGALTLIGLMAPSIVIPATLVWLLTVGTIVETVVKHFIDTKIKHLQPTVNEAFLNHGGRITMPKVINLATAV